MAPPSSPAAWMAPDARPQVATTEVDDAVAAGETAAVEPPVPRPMPLRPMTIADLLDGSIAVIKAAPRTIIVIAAAVVVPLELLTSWLRRDSLSDSGLSAIWSAAQSTSSTQVDVTLTTIVSFVLSGIVLSVVAGAIAHVLSAWYADRNTTAGAALSASISRLPSLVVAWVIVHVIESAGLVAFFVGQIFLMPLFVVVAPAIVVERLGPWKGIRRSIRLTQRRYGAVLGTVVLVAIVDGLLTIALTGVGLLFEFFDWGWIVDAVFTAGSGLITVPFVAGVATLLYFDLRVRSEGLDLELGIAAHFSSAR